MKEPYAEGSSNPRRPQAVRRRPQGRRRSVGRGTSRQGIQPRNQVTFGVPTPSTQAEGNMVVAKERATGRLCAVLDPSHARNLHAREPGGPLVARGVMTSGRKREGPRARDRR
jgi:hypothetical protein